MEAQPENILIFRRGRAELKIKVKNFPTSGRVVMLKQSAIISVSPAMKYLVGREVRIVGLLNGHGNQRRAQFEEA